MARKTATVVIGDEGRDKGKVFILTELPASRAEKWAMRAILALQKSGAELPDDISQAGMAGVAVVGLQALGNLNFYDAETLLDEMFECISYQPDPKIPGVVRPLIEDDIEEVKTRIRLRAEVFQLHVNFSIAGLGLKSTPETTEPDSKNIPTSPVRSGPLSHRAKRR